MDEESLRIQQQGINSDVLRAASTAQQAAHLAATNALHATQIAASEAEKVGRLSRELDSYEIAVKQKNRELTAQKQKIEQLVEDLARKEKALLEWMHSHEAFRRLAKNYAKYLNRSQEDYENELDQYRIDVAEEDQKYKSTDVLDNAIKRRQSRSK